MSTRWEVEQAARELHPDDFIHLQGGPRDGDTLLAPGHSGKICIGFVANQVPRLGAELIYEPVSGKKTAEGARVYRLVLPGRLEVHDDGQSEVSNISPIRPLEGSPQEGA